MDNHWKKIIESTDTLSLLTVLKDHDINIFYDVIYKILNECPEKILNNKYTAAQQLEALNKIIKHFTEKEEYERCIKIKQIIDGIEKDIILSND
tara:strand:- start:104 stop:385 length:282 start_codon:yes stop_codon:yes gene_type:complete